MTFGEWIRQLFSRQQPATAPPVPPSPAPGGPSPGTVRDGIIDLTDVHNLLRTTGPRLRRAAILEGLALEHARRMATVHTLAHSGLADGDIEGRANGAGYHWSALGENIAKGQKSVADVMGTWRDSPLHLANIVNPDFTEMGAAVVTDATGVPYWCVVFGRRA